MNNTESFAQAVDVTAFAPLYNLGAGIFRAQMREFAASPIIEYEWSTENGQILYTITPANAAIAFTVNPIATQTLTIGATTVTFVSSGASGLQVNVAGSLSGTLSNLMTFLGASSDSQILLCSYQLLGTTITLTAVAPGWQGNSIAIATTVLGASISNPAIPAGSSTPPTTLAGGSHTVTLLAPVADVFNFGPTTNELTGLGVYAFDCRLETSGVNFAVLFGGTIQWDQGVAREITDTSVELDLIPAMAYVSLAPSMIEFSYFRVT